MTETRFRGKRTRASSAPKFRLRWQIFRTDCHDENTTNKVHSPSDQVERLWDNAEEAMPEGTMPVKWEERVGHGRMAGVRQSKYVSLVLVCVQQKLPTDLARSHPIIPADLALTVISQSSSCLPDGVRGLRVFSLSIPLSMDTNTNGSSSSGSVKKQEDVDSTDPKGTVKNDSKPPVRTLNRVPRTPLMHCDYLFMS